MKYLLAARYQETLEALARTRALLAFDFDGTLAPIHPDRDLARMRDSTRALLDRACELYPCAVISGRALEDLRARLGPSRVKYLVGNHGIEPGEDLKALEQETTLVGPLLAEALSEIAGVELERKQYSLTVHYRGSKKRSHARKEIARVIQAIAPSMRTIAGKCVINLVPARALHKGDSVLRLLKLEKTAMVLYVGDDVTDEDVFELHQPDWLVTVRVGRHPSSSATFRLASQRQIDRLLERLIELSGRNFP